jgi:hypothetical protein
MLRIRRPPFVLAAAALCLLALAGCGTKGYTVTGKLALPQNVKLAPDDSVTILFVSEDPKEKGSSSAATFSAADSSFVAKGPEGKGMSPGKYKLVVQINPYSGKPDSDQRAKQFSGYNSAYDMANTKLNYEVTKDSSQSITIDLTKGTVTKG